jgi:hypothetical protein
MFYLWKGSIICVQFSAIGHVNIAKGVGFMALSELPGDLFKWVLEFALQQAIQNVPIWMGRAKERRRERSEAISIPHNIHIPRVTLVDREREFRAIRAAISDAPHSHVIYFYGSGGAGKTRLLEETTRLIKSLRTSLPVRWAGVLDLYHIEHHSISDLQMAIIQSLDPDQTLVSAKSDGLLAG